MKWRRIVLIAIALVLVAGYYVPRISAGAYRDRVHAALERALGRKVRIGDVRFRLLPTPGLELSNVEIGEDPVIGPESAAYVTTLVAVPRLSSLLGGPLEFSSVDLEDETSLNLTRVDNPRTGVTWNFASLMRPETLAAFPSIHMRGGRINFKFGDTKSLFYLLNTDVDLWPPGSPNGPWTLRVHAEPARTDRRARGFGSFVMRGQWLPKDRAVILDVKLEQSELGDMMTLFNGYEAGFHGDVSGDAHLAGPLNRIGIAGRMTVSDLHGWSQAPPGGNAWHFAIGGAIDVPGQMIDINGKVAGAQSPLAVRYRVADYLRHPRWGVTVNLNHFPLAPLPEIARNLGWPAPAGFKLEGAANGAVGYSMPEGTPRMDGEMNLTDAKVTAGGAPPLNIRGAEVHFSGSRIALETAEVSNDSGETAAIAGAWDSSSDTSGNKLIATLSSDGMSIASLRKQISVAGIPVLSQATSGTWKGALRYADGDWTGAMNIADADIPFEAFAAPVHLISADATIGDGGLALTRVNLALGDLRAQGEYRYEAKAARPHKFRLVIGQADGPATGQLIEKLMMPALRRGNILTYAFNFGRAPQPDWLRNMRADGTIQTAQLDMGGGHFSKLRARVIWEGTDVRLGNLETQVGDAQFKGTAAIHLAGRQPAYEVRGKLNGLAWRNGTVSADGTLSTSGTGTALLGNMRVQGTFDGSDVEVTPADSYDSVSGTFEWAAPRLRFPQVTMKAGADTYLGSAEMDDSGQLVLKVSDGTKRIQAAGAILRGEALKQVP
ncbi:MAG TPA: hypothetical protein VG297_12950 [Bryobacteraceae bacterium]|nr:hypothetical protein [Bryobacteraceae bacterium]